MALSPEPRSSDALVQEVTRFELTPEQERQARADLAGVRAVFFDLDDTLCLYWNASKAGLRATFERHPIPDLAPDALLGHWAEAFREYAPLIKGEAWYPQYLKSGDPTRREHFRRMLAQVSVTDETLVDALSATYRELRDAHLELFPDAQLVLERLKGRYPLGLITNGPADIQRQEVATLGIGPYFAHFFIEGELGFGKPEPEVFRRAAAAAGQAPEACLMVGNSYRHDIRPAVEAGWKTIWLRRDSDVPPSAHPNTRPEGLPENAPEPTLTLDRLEPIVALLDV